MMKRSRLRWTACVLTGILVSVQAVFAFAACMPPASEPAQAIAQTEVPPCHEQDAQVDGLCVLHCVGDRQSLDKPSVKVPVLGEGPVLVVRAQMPRGAFAVCNLSIPACVSTPPPRILFSKLLI